MHQGAIRTRRAARHSGHLSFALCCVRASQSRQMAWSTPWPHAHRPFGARDEASGDGHGSVMVSKQTGQSWSAASSHQGGVFGATGAAFTRKQQPVQKSVLL